MRDGIVEAFLVKVDKDIRDSARLLVGKRRGWDAYNFLRDMLPAVTPPSQKEIAQANEAIHAAMRNGRAGGVKVARKRLMGLLPAVDRAGKTWKPDYKGPLNKAVFPAWGKVPVYVPKLVQHMNEAEAKVIIVIGDIVDHQGNFKVPRAWLAERIGASEPTAYRAIKTLQAAGLIKVKMAGKKDQATVWSYAPVAEVDLGKATQVLRARHRDVADDVEARMNRDHTRRFAGIAAAIAKLAARALVLDGEVAIYDQQLRSRFDWLSEPDADAVATPPMFMVFDLLHHDGRELTGRPLRDRRARLENVVAGSEFVLPVRRLAANGFEAWAEVVAHDYEGLVAKEEASLYEAGPTRRWLKVKQKGWTDAEDRWQRRISAARNI